MDVKDGRIVGYGTCRKGAHRRHKGQARLEGDRVHGGPVRGPPPDPEVGDTSVRFIQTAGGRTGAPAPRRVKRKPFFKIDSPTGVETLALTIHADGSAEHELIGASPFPRHWVYDDSGQLVAKIGLVDFKNWFREAFGKHTPWGDQDSPALVTEVESALERELSKSLMRGDAKPEVRKLAKGDTLTEQGEEGPSCSCCWTAFSTVEVRRRALWRMSARARSSESEPCSRGASARRHCER